MRDCSFRSTSEKTVTGSRAAFGPAAVLAASCFLALAITALLSSGCAGAGTFPAPTAKNVAYAERHGQITTLPTLKVGRKLYISRCSSCHSLKSPEFLMPDEWPDMVRRMADNSKLTPDQERAITHYLVSVSAAVRDTADGTATTP
jgi:cytochrome c5